MTTHQGGRESGKIDVIAEIPHSKNATGEFLQKAFEDEQDSEATWQEEERFRTVPRETDFYVELFTWSKYLRMLLQGFVLVWKMFVSYSLPLNLVIWGTRPHLA